ncbi:MULTISPECIES: hypothetical protein [Rhodomicrobium]|uniref:hypothetical protein n=1 Tax=Rhodomicrobium TaxID=1068 RepID=UPI000F742DA2|nr:MULTISPECIES: hypothetical protein [Rhodomicrobium]
MSLAENFSKITGPVNLKRRKAASATGRIDVQIQFLGGHRERFDTIRKNRQAVTAAKSHDILRTGAGWSIHDAMTKINA